MHYPDHVLMCPPDYFDVVDVKNPFMKHSQGKVNKEAAQKQWLELQAAFMKVGLTVKEILPSPHLEDMVFCANQTFVGLTESGEKLCVLGQMRFESRNREVPAFARWFQALGYRVVSLGDPGLKFEGGGDAVWHPGKRLIWGGVGPRTDAAAYVFLSNHFGARIEILELATEKFYHLDTCFAILNADTVLVHPEAFTKKSLAKIERGFKRVIAVETSEAEEAMACNAAAFFGNRVVIDAQAQKTANALKSFDFEVVMVDTSEFKKSGGSVFCLKQAFWG